MMDYLLIAYFLSIALLMRLVWVHHYEKVPLSAMPFNDLLNALSKQDAAYFNKVWERGWITRREFKEITSKTNYQRIQISHEPDQYQQSR